MKDYSYIIDEECSGAKTSAHVRQIIPILVEWAKKGETHHTYGDLNKRLGRRDGRCSSIGHPLGCIKHVFQRLKDEAGFENIPTLNALVSNAKTKLPSEGFSYIHPNYEKQDDITKQIIVGNANNAALNFDKWDHILALLGLKPALSEEDENKIRSGSFGFGGEGKEHQRIKKFITAYPKSIGMPNIGEGICEHILLSGDKLDVFFPKGNVAVEVKPKSAPDSDILRGLFQCVKYKTILDAEAKVKGTLPNGKVVLVLGGTLSPSNQNVKECLGVDVIENFIPKMSRRNVL